jgi:NAD(P)-dependent dehydrogenase (short-subunit alcohol dehydrogenase family)
MTTDTDTEIDFDFDHTIEILSSSKGVVLITGASTGIGYASAFYLAQAGYTVFAGVRKSKDAYRIKQDADDKDLSHYLWPIQLDICNADHVQSAQKKIRSTLEHAGISYLHALVNNAGIALGGPLLELDLNILRTQLEVNVIGQLAMIQAFADLLGPINGQQQEHAKTSRCGKVIQISSISGMIAMPFLGPYSASKFALEGLSDALRMELMPYGIDVVIIQPGPISTPIWDKAPTIDQSPYENSPYANALIKFHKFVIEGGKKGLDAIEIAKIVKRSIESSKPAARYVKTPGSLWRYWLPKLLPTRMFDRQVTNRLDLSPKKFNRED